MLCKAPHSAQAALGKPAHAAPGSPCHVAPCASAAPCKMRASKKQALGCYASAAGQPAQGGTGNDDLSHMVANMASRYLGGFSRSMSGNNTRGWSGRLFATSSRSSQQPAPGGIHILLSALIAIWALGSAFGAPASSKLLALEGGAGWRKWWAVLTDALWSRTPDLLARNVFMGYVFGRTVESAEGPQGLWLTYALAAAGGGLAACMLLSRRAPIQGSSAAGALFGLFLMATLFNRRKTWHWQRVFELGVLGPFLVLQLLAGQAGCAQWWTPGGARMGAWAPLLGGAVGAALAAGLLHLARLVANATARQRPQQQPAAALPPPEELEEPVTLLLNKLAAFLVKRVLP